MDAQAATLSLEGVPTRASAALKEIEEAISEVNAAAAAILSPDNTAADLEDPAAAARKPAADTVANTAAVTEDPAAAARKSAANTDANKEDPAAAARKSAANQNDTCITAKEPAADGEMPAARIQNTAVTPKRPATNEEQTAARTKPPAAKGPVAEGSAVVGEDAALDHQLQILRKKTRNT